MNKRLFLFLSVLACIFSCSTSGNLSGETVPSESLVWQVSGGELAGKSYIVGTLPVQDSAFFAYPDKVWDYLEKSDVFVSFDETTVPNQQELRNEAFSSLGKHYGVLPAAYFQQIASQQMKPVVSINSEYSLQNIEIADKPTEQNTRDELIEAFRLGNSADLVQLRTNLDLSSNQLEQLQNRNNYLILDELVRHMRLQPVFFPVDVAYVTGTNGLVGLLRARGYQVEPQQERFYANFAKQIAQQRALLAMQQNQTTTMQTQPNVSVYSEGESYGNYEFPQETVPLNLPIGLLNIGDWPTYAIADSSLLYRAPARLKSTSELQEEYSTIHDNLTYEIKLQDLPKNFDAAIQQLIIQQGGQLVNSEKAAINGFPTRIVELIYAENHLSKHVLLPLQSQLAVFSVKGNTPQIVSLQAEQFLNSIEVNQALLLANQQTTTTFDGETMPGNQPAEPIAQQPIWQANQLMDLSVYLPIPPEELSHQLENGNNLTGLVIPRGEIDNNMYLLTATKQNSIDNFKLFNDAINATATEARAVIINRNVMPQGQSYFSSYTLRDAVDNHYKVNYWYVNGVFYQFIIRGDKRSIQNQTATQIQQSIQVGQQPMINGAN